MSKFRILYVLNQARIAGTERHLLLLLKHLNRDIFEPSVACLSDGPLTRILNQQGIEARAFVRKGFFDLTTAKRLQKYIREKSFQLLHSHCGHYACILAKLAGTPVILETRHGLYYNFDEMEQAAFLRYLINKTKAAYLNLTLTVCETDRFLLNTKFGISQDKVQTVVNGIDISDFAHLKTEKNVLKKELGIKANEKIVGTVARCTEQKGLEYLIKAIARVQGCQRKVKLILVGDGILKPKLQELAGQLNISDDIVFPGYREDALDILSLFDIFVLPSLWEGMPYTILEAMALKKPVITTNVFGNAEVVLHEKTGLLVPPRDPVLLADAIDRLIRNPVFSQQLGEAGFLRVKTKFSAEEMTRKTEHIYLNLLNGENER